MSEQSRINTILGCLHSNDIVVQECTSNLCIIVSLATSRLLTKYSHPFSNYMIWFRLGQNWKSRADDKLQRYRWDKASTSRIHLWGVAVSSKKIGRGGHTFRFKTRFQVGRHLIERPKGGRVIVSWRIEVGERTISQMASCMTSCIVLKLVQHSENVSLLSSRLDISVLQITNQGSTFLTVVQVILSRFKVS